MTYPGGNTNNPRARAEQDDARAELEAWCEGRRPLPNVGHDPRFTRIYSDGPHWGYVTVIAPDGELERFRVHLDCEREAAFYREHQERS